MVEKKIGVFNKKLLTSVDKTYSTVEQWYKDDPHSLKRSTFSHLNSNSIVFDLGGYEGQWTSDIYSRYRCTVYVFEPVKKYFEVISERFKKNPDIRVFNSGLGQKGEVRTISVNQFSSSIVKSFNNCNTETINIIEFESFLENKSIKVIDLIKINIEGSEYDLLDHLIKNNLIRNIKGLLVQFHSFVPEAGNRMNKIRAAFSKSHKPVYQYDFVWEYWELIY